MSKHAEAVFWISLNLPALAVNALAAMAGKATFITWVGIAATAAACLIWSRFFDEEA